MKRSQVATSLVLVALAGCAALANNQISAGGTAGGKGGESSTSPSASTSSTTSIAASPSAVGMALPDLPPGVTPLVSAQLGSYQIGPLDGKGNLYFVYDLSGGGGAFGRVNISSGSVSLVGASSGGSANTLGPVDASGDEFFPYFLGSAGGILRLTPDGQLSALVPAPTSGSSFLDFGTPYGGPGVGAVDASGNLYLIQIPDSNSGYSGALVKVSPTGQLTTLVATDVVRVGPVDPAGDIYFATEASPSLSRISAAGLVTVLATVSVGTSALSGGQLSYFNFGQMDGAGDVYFSQLGVGGVGVVSPGGSVTDVPGQCYGLSEAVAQGWAYYLSAQGTIYKMTTSGLQSAVASLSLTDARVVLGPTDASGDLFFASNSTPGFFPESSVEEMSPAGQVTTLVSSSDGGSFQLGPLDQDGNLYLSFDVGGVDPWIGKIHP